MASTKQHEQKLMQEKVAKVREVVKNASTNDIILALHNFDLSVERTVHAFCEGGFDMALGDWEKTSGSKKKQNKNKSTANKSATNIINNNNNSVKLATSTTASSGFPSQQVAEKPHIDASPASEVTASSLVSNLSPSVVSSCNGVGTHQQQQRVAHSPLSNGVKIAEKKKKNKEKKGGGVAEPVTAMAASPLASVAPVDGKAVARGNINSCGQESSHAQTQSSKLVECFKEIRNALDIRERHLAKELAQLEASGANGFMSMNLDPGKLISLIGQVGEIKKSSGDPTYSANSGAVASDACIKQKPATNGSTDVTQKRTNSPSSQVSSVGETDSGLGQISPVHQAKKNAICDNGIGIESDAFSMDELAELQRNIMAQLKAKGIDPSILATISANPPAVRSRPPKNNAESGPGKKGPVGQKGGGDGVTKGGRDGAGKGRSNRT